MKLKKILAVVLATATIATSAMGITANAANETFSFDLDPYGDSDWSYGNEKDDNEQTAYIHPQTGYVNSTHCIYFTLYKATNTASSNKISNSKKISSLGGTYTIPYTTYRGTGSISYIYANTSYYDANVVGYWYS